MKMIISAGSAAPEKKSKFVFVKTFPFLKREEDDTFRVSGVKEANFYANGVFSLETLRGER